MIRFRCLVASVVLALGLPALAQAPSARPSPQPQPRAHGSRVTVDPQAVEVDDGDTVVIRWRRG
jgi:hypothetical protein